MTALSSRASRGFGCHGLFRGRHSPTQPRPTRQRVAIAPKGHSRGQDGSNARDTSVLRRELGVFSPETVATLQTFAAQSVLAIQNARLFREIED
jgi:GAF domain-containing protein